jgi:hypothetical protein
MIDVVLSEGKRTPAALRVGTHPRSRPGLGQGEAGERLR